MSKLVRQIGVIHIFGCLRSSTDVIPSYSMYQPAKNSNLFHTRTFIIVSILQKAPRGVIFLINPDVKSGSRPRCVGINF